MPYPVHCVFIARSGIPVQHNVRELAVNRKHMPASGALMESVHIHCDDRNIVFRKRIVRVVWLGAVAGRLHLVDGFLILLRMLVRK